MKGIVCWLLALGLLSIVTVSAALAGVNCRQVRRYAATGRTPEDISMTMIIDIETIKKCLAEEDQETKPTPGDKKD